MAEFGASAYIAVFAVTTLLTLVLTPLALRTAVRRGFVDRPGLIKVQDAPVPYLGGLAIVTSFAVVALLAAVVRRPESGLDELAVILGLAIVLSVVGLVDDLRGLSPWLRLGIEILAAIAVWATPASADVFDNDVLNLVVTVLWIVGVTNALNLLDNMDGLSAGVAAIAAFFIFVMAASNGQFLVAVLAIGLAGCALGFLRSNFHPATIYMGDAGALFFGFLLAVLTMKLDFLEAPRLVAVAVPVVVLGIPLFDTTLVTVNRLLHKRSPLAGGRDHTSHRLVFVGIPVPASVTLIYVASASLGCLAYILSKQDVATGMVLLGWVVGLSVLIGVLLSRVPVYETSRRRHLMLQEVQKHEPEPVVDAVTDGTIRSA